MKTWEEIYGRPVSVIIPAHRDYRVVYRERGCIRCLTGGVAEYLHMTTRKSSVYIRGLGTQAGTFVTPVAIENIGNTISSRFIPSRDFNI